ncbi:PilC/PilY family type IV pilus protein [Parendozoicomonas sp. Alg238-R29]|uniref:pilus assembly protein n=1 Tax=Parendozoicomonas sp. Alg238-R29 TaxID=2993446 RepID=UPI00248F4582|nr:PilC/PilY family type IV pilus protein [Parendozoicomonas sp. Alg238-R29]
MNKKISNKLLALALSTFLGAGTFHSALADDTEIFFGGQASGQVIAPNVLFILDNSGSMNNRICRSGDRACENDPDRANKTRMQQLQASFSDLLDSTQNLPLNAGLLRFWKNNSYDDTNGVYHEVENLENPVASIPVEVVTPDVGVGDADENSLNNQVDTTDTAVRVGVISNGAIEAFPLPINGNNFGSEATGGGVNLGSYMRFYPNYHNSYYFEGFNIPANAVIIEARLDMQAYNVSTWVNSTNTVEISADTILNTPLNNSSRHISNRKSTQIPAANRVQWRMGDNRIGTGNWFQTPDISSVIQGVVNSNPGTDITSLAFLFNPETANSNLETYYDNQAARVPRLHIRYSAPASGGQLEAHTAGFRFSDVAVPQGATITKATLRLTPDSDNASTPTFIIKAENVGNSATFAETDNNISDRALTSSSTSWTLSPWQVTDSNGDRNLYETDVTSSLQEVVSRSDWCGGNAATFIIAPENGSSGFRDIASEEASAPPPALAVEYTVSGTPGCSLKTIKYPIIDRGNDAIKHNSATSTTLTSVALNLPRGDVGLRFSQFPVLKDVDIQEAFIEFTASENSNSTFATTISGEKVDDSEPFTQSKTTISARTVTSSTVSWTPETVWEANKTYRSPDVSDILEEIVSKSGWSAGNALTLFVKTNTPTSSKNKRAYSWDGSPSQAPRLIIKLSEDGFNDSITTHRVRDRLKSYVNELKPGRGTPIIKSLLQAQSYYSGSNSPMTNTCQSNHIVLLSDGSPNGFHSSEASQITSRTGTTCNYNSSISRQQTCGRILTKWMEENDQKSSLDGENTITTHTIGFAASGSALGFLEGVASKKDDDSARYYTATDAASLTQAFGKILQEILSVEASFNSASISVNQYRSYQHNNELYYALFTPNDKTNWSGNLKKYKLGTNNDQTSFFLVDKNGKKAVDKDTGGFKERTTSFWSSSPDGGQTQLGGAASRLPNPDQRQIYTDVGLDAGDPLTAEPLTVSNSTITKGILGNPSMSNDYRSDIINWGRGYNQSGSIRQQIGDPLHSQPALVTYGCREYQDPDDKSKGCAPEKEDISLFFGTNQGFLHAISGTTGTNRGREIFSYIPEELLKNLEDYMVDPETGNSIKKPYGIDGSPIAWRIDHNKNGAIEASEGDKVYLYFGLRRGGDLYYALDITNRNDPKLKWKISSASTGMSKLGQTWSKPARTKVIIDNVVKRALIFGGGYDTSNDISGSPREDDAKGNALFIVDAENGDLLWSATNNSSGSLKLDKMDYSIPGDITVLDLNLDGFGDQIVFGDMGGQVWRLFIDQRQSRSSQSLIVTPFGGTRQQDAQGVVADLAGTDAKGNRRFYMKPVTGITQTGDRKLFSIAIGSGYRAHPLDETVDDRVYVLKSAAVFDNPLSVKTLTESDLYDATDNKVQTGNESEVEAAQRALDLIPVNSDGSQKTGSDGAPLPPLSNGGWYIRLEESGEKALSDISLIDGYFSWASYEPAAQSNSCKAVLGTNRLYRVSAKDGSAPDNQRKKIIQNTGIVSSTRLVVIKSSELVNGDPDDDGHKLFECVGTECYEAGSGGIIQQTGWIDKKTH